MRTFAGKLAILAALAGFVLVVVLAGAGYTLVSTIRVGNEALSTYADELILAWSLQEAHERKLASGRGYLIAPDEAIKRELDKASTDTEAVLVKLRERVKSPEGVALLDESARALDEHDRALASRISPPWRSTTDRMLFSISSSAKREDSFPSLAWSPM